MADIEKLKALAEEVRALEDSEHEDELAEAKDALWLHMHCHTILDLIAELEGYQMGATAEADAADEARAEVGRLKAENETLREYIEDLALSLECEVKARYAGTQDHPAIKRRYDGDMQEVIDARALLGKTPK